MRSPLAALDLALRTTAEAAGVHLSERPLGKVELRGDARDAGFLRLVQETTGLLLPPVGGMAVAGAVTALGLGPDEWLLLLPPGEGAGLAGRLDAATGERHGLALEASSAWTTLRLAGPAAVELLAGLVAIDLDPPAFAPGRCAATRLGSTRVVLVQVDDTPVFDLHLPRSLAVGLWEQIAATARPFGLAVVPIPA
jgi:sarcosine oxidase subunit gamma